MSRRSYRPEAWSAIARAKACEPLPRVIVPEYEAPRDQFGFRSRFHQGRVYFLLVSGLSCPWPVVKIGFTEDLERRLNQLAFLYGRNLIGSIPGTRQTETKAHHAFRDLRYRHGIGRETFVLTAELDFVITSAIRMAGVE